MKAYNYLLFRIYSFYTDTRKEKDIPLFYTSGLSATLVGFNLFTIYVYLEYRGFFKDIIPSKYYILIPITLLWTLNYFLFVKGKGFLDYNFKKDVRGGLLMVMYMIISLASFIVVANINRSKIEKQHSSHPTTTTIKQRPSLEGKIRKWLNDTF